MAVQHLKTVAAGTGSRCDINEEIQIFNIREVNGYTEKRLS
jgi:hypothetical protein